ncbi:transcriptional regulator, LysR family [Magnetococcus marinus MC-1]|uniref:Transcriptional regulator, LysR family n=1 Tax=Magnetococcus marinus (strain ATCC BAA-1437 / JCM 17883 / MC-1) TaxID=156889 RepID=A0LC85_MAGMM|nr:LysR family transcriptional regulator [Magnetococcus marinus]ABK45578.1 transcriptional regulator, LysR family [Magnetococcus marinus MC-1]
MDIDQLRTFLEVNRTRHFGRASQNLFVTQSAISSRIKQLEEELSIKLFTRARNDIQLTVAGKRFLKTAEMIVSMWEQARHSIQLSNEDKPMLVVGGIPSLWEIILKDWVLDIHQSHPELILSCDSEPAQSIIQRVLGKTLDLGFVYTSQKLVELEQIEITPLQLIMVSDRPELTPQQAIKYRYHFVDWGQSFGVAHARWFPELPHPFLRLGWGGMALESLVKYGGVAYLPDLMVREFLQRGALFPVQEAPTFSRQVYAIFREEHPLKGFILQLLEKLQPGHA